MATRRSQGDITRQALERRAAIVEMLKSAPASEVARHFGVTAVWIYQVAKFAASSSISPALDGLSPRALNALQRVGVSLRTGTRKDVAATLPSMKPGRPRNCGTATLSELRAWVEAEAGKDA